MAVEITFRGDAHTVRAEIEAFMAPSRTVEAAAEKVQSAIDHAAIDSTKRAREHVRKAAESLRRAASKKDEPKQVDLEEAIDEAVRRHPPGHDGRDIELNDEIPDLTGGAAPEADEPEEQAASVSKDDVRTALISLMKAKGDDAPTALLKKEFNVSKIGELNEADYASVVAKANAAIKGE